MPNSYLAAALQEQAERRAAAEEAAKKTTARTKHAAKAEKSADHTDADQAEKES